MSVSAKSKESLRRETLSASVRFLLQRREVAVFERQQSALVIADHLEEMREHAGHLSQLPRHGPDFEAHVLGRELERRRKTTTERTEIRPPRLLHHAASIAHGAALRKTLSARVRD
jgi:hypothetical protein